VEDNKYMAKRKKSVKKSLKIRHNALVRFIAPLDRWEDYPFSKYQKFVFLGEIIQMPGHCIVVDLYGQTYISFHVDDFEEIPEEEC